MAIPSPPASSFSPSFCRNRTDSSLSVAGIHRRRNLLPIRRFSIVSRLNSAKSSGPNGSVSPDNGEAGDAPYELQHGFLRLQQKGSPVFVTLPVDVVDLNGMLRRRKVIAQSFRALVAAGVEGVVMEIWWGLVEKKPSDYRWTGYTEIVSLARDIGLKVRAVMSFHQRGSGPGDPLWIPLPAWVREEMVGDPELSYADRFGRKSMEYISLGCDLLPVLKGRSPIQTYSDFMRSFRDALQPFLGDVITGIQIGMGPGGELRYPSCPSHKLALYWKSRELGDFQCYDKYMMASLNACAEKVGMRGWGNIGPVGTGSLMHNPEQSEFFRREGKWDSSYGKFFLEWYSGMLLLHAERICITANSIFKDTNLSISTKLAGIYWHFHTCSHASELTAGYYNTSKRDGYLPFLRLFGKYGITLCCSCFEMRDINEWVISQSSSPEGFLRQLLMAAHLCGVPLDAEIHSANLSDKSFQQVLKTSRFYLEGLEEPLLSFNFVRMNKNMFEPNNWGRFVKFMKRISESDIFRAKLDFRGGDSCSSYTSYTVKVAYC